MKRLLLALVCFLVRAASAQINPTAQSNVPPLDEPRRVEVRGDGRCITVRPGDIVGYTLTVENLGNAHALYGDLRLRLGRTRELLRGGLPLPDSRSLGGGGLGKRDEQDARQYHFSFAVPEAIVGGTYHGVVVEVRTDQAASQPSIYRSADEPVPGVDVTRHTRDAVRAYCLNVMSTFGTAPARPAVVNFEAGAVAPSPAPPKPQPLPRQPAPVSLDPVPQPR